MDILKMRKVFKNLSFSIPRVTKNSTSVPNNKKDVYDIQDFKSGCSYQANQPNIFLNKATVVIHNALVINFLFLL